MSKYPWARLNPTLTSLLAMRSLDCESVYKEGLNPQGLEKKQKLVVLKVAWICVIIRWLWFAVKRGLKWSVSQEKAPFKFSTVVCFSLLRSLWIGSCFKCLPTVTWRVKALFVISSVRTIKHRHFKLSDHKLLFGKNKKSNQWSLGPYFYFYFASRQKEQAMSFSWTFSTRYPLRSSWAEGPTATTRSIPACKFKSLVSRQCSKCGANQKRRLREATVSKSLSCNNTNT